MLILPLVFEPSLYLEFHAVADLLVRRHLRKLLTKRLPHVSARLMTKALSICIDEMTEVKLCYNIDMMRLRLGTWYFL